METFMIACKSKQYVNAAKIIYGECWESVKKETLEKHIIPHHEKNKTTNLLSSAIRLSDKQDERLTLLLLASVFDS